MRQGEVFWLALEDVDFLRKVVHVRRQVILLDGHQCFSMPKGRKDRDVPLPDAVARALALHMQVFPPQEVTLPWDTLEGTPTTARLIVTSRESKALNRNYINTHVWKPALRAAGLPDGRDQGMHAGRHFFASLQLEEGTNIKALAEYLGHSDPGFTLRTYAHLMPKAEDKARRAVDRVFDRLEEAANDPSRGPSVSQGEA